VHDVMLEAIDDVLRKYGKPSVREIDETHHWGGGEAQKAASDESIPELGSPRP
jgi:hypothetical protein